MVVPFNLERLEVTGSQIAVVDDVMQAANMSNSVADSGAGQFAVSPGGTLVYATGGVQPSEPGELVWTDRTGQTVPVGAPRGPYGSPRLSPDGRRILMFSGSTPDDSANRLWVYDMTRGTHTAVTPRDERIVWGIWSPDGTQVVFEKLEAGRGTLHVRLADGSGKAERIAEPRPVFQTPGSWSPSGTLAFVEAGAATATDIRVLDMTSGDRPDTLAVQTEGSDSFPAFSSDGKWLAYSSSVSGRYEVYVQPFPGPGPRVLVSTNGGSAPAWRGDGRELYYYWPRTDRNAIGVYVVPVTFAGSMLTVGAPQLLFEGNFSTTFPARGYDVTPDGQRFLFVRHLEPPPPPPGQLVLVENFAEELKPRARKE